MTELRPFWGYYGAKWQLAPRYAPPRYPILIEPFAGAAGYSLRYPDRRVILVDKYPVIAGIWRYLIGASAAEIRRIPIVTHSDDLPGWVPPEAVDLVRFNMAGAVASGQSAATIMATWTAARRARIAHQIDRIRHWTILEGSYTQAPDVAATWFIDPPYNNLAGSYYRHGSKGIDYTALGAWCIRRSGQVVVCENAGADWLDFRHFHQVGAKVWNEDGSVEVVWTADHVPQGDPMTVFEQLVAMATDGHPITAVDLPCASCGVPKYGPRGMGRKRAFLFLARACLEELGRDFDMFGADIGTRVQIEEMPGVGSSGFASLDGGSVHITITHALHPTDPSGVFVRTADGSRRTLIAWAAFADPRAFARRVEDWLETSDDVVKTSTLPDNVRRDATDLTGE